MLYYQQSFESVLKHLGVSQQGLTGEEVKARQEKYGANILQQKKRISPRKIFFQQFKSALILVLLGATLVSALVGERVDALVIVLIVILNAVFGFIQEYKAEKAIEGLKKMMNPLAKVLRDGKKIQIPSSELTVGDILFLEEGDKIPADGRIIQAINLEVLEASLTGESLPVKKLTESLTSDLALGDQKNMIFSGTVVTKGRGMAVLTDIGMQTQIGKIADMIQNSPEKQTNLQKKLEKLSKTLGWIILGVCIVVFLAYYFVDHESLLVAFLTAVALAVAAIPEGLPAVVTISLALGVNRMVKKNALMRRLSSVETLGSVDVICTDKTGTLTKNQMTVTQIFADNKSGAVTGTGYEAQGQILHTASNKKTLDRLLEIGVLCNQSSRENGVVVGDPTEGCLRVSAFKGGLDTKKLLQDHVRVHEIPFDSTRKMMSSIYKKDKNYMLCSKGAPEIVLLHCTKIMINGEVQPLSDEYKKNILSQNDIYAKNALRVLAFAYKYSAIDDVNIQDITEEELIFVGLQAMIDPPREEVKDAINICKKAGIRVIMITGDNILTAQAIATQLGTTGDAMQGLELDNHDDITEILKTTSIFARVNPEHKQKIITALKQMGHIVAMTGDGVNDAPALKKADIGVAMGITGTDVSKEASDMILLDDNFRTIVSAIEEGRGIFDNIKKFVNFLLATNFGEIAVIFTASMIGLPLPLIAIQILWINLVTDGLPALALGVDPIDPKIMHRKPRPANQNILTPDMIRNILLIGLIVMISAMVFFRRHQDVNIEQARTGVFLLMVFLELVKVQIIRARFGGGLWQNKRLRAALAVSAGLVLLVVYTPLASVFGTQAPSAHMRKEIAIIFVIAILTGITITLMSRKNMLKHEQVIEKK